MTDSTTPASTTPASTTPASTTPASTTPASTPASSPATATITSPPPPAPPVPAAFVSTLDEYCANASNAEGSPELLGAFHADQTAKGKVAGMAADWDAALEAFRNRPVE